MEPWPTDSKEDGFTERDGFMERPAPSVPPWELPGQFRRDCAPHRAGLLGALANTSALVGTLSLVPPFALACAPLGALLGLPLGLTAWVLARRDLAEMRAGRTDPSGEAGTEAARKLALLGVVTGLLSVALCAGVSLVLLREG